MATRRAFLTDTKHRIRFVYLPKHSSWLNQIEIIFGIIQRKCLRGGNFKSVDDLEAQIRQFIAYYNTTMAHPFNWTYTGKPLEKKRRSFFVPPHRRERLSKFGKPQPYTIPCTAT
jgi:transposase